jgi:hypothetical protein
MAFTGSYNAGHNQKAYGGVLLNKVKRSWQINIPPPDELRQDIGLGHALHFAAVVSDLGATAIVCPMMVQLRTADQLRAQLDDMPEDYYTKSQFVVAIIQAPDSRKLYRAIADSDDCVQKWQTGAQSCLARCATTRSTCWFTTSGTKWMMPQRQGIQSAYKRTALLAQCISSRSKNSSTGIIQHLVCVQLIALIAGMTLIH